jgi:predicted transcriptional regulator
MKIRKFLIVFLMSIIAFTEIPQAIFTSNSYKQGIYNISEDKEFNATAKLITPNNVTSLIIIDSNGNQKFYKRFDTVDEIINLGFIKNGDLIAIVGKGEIAIIVAK